MDDKPKCLYCERGDDVVPLVNLIYQGKTTWICAQHFPILIHEPEKLAGKLPGMEKQPPAHDHDHHHA